MLQKKQEHSLRRQRLSSGDELGEESRGEGSEELGLVCAVRDQGGECLEAGEAKEEAGDVGEDVGAKASVRADFRDKRSSLVKRTSQHPGELPVIEARGRVDKLKEMLELSYGKGFSL